MSQQSKDNSKLISKLENNFTLTLTGLSAPVGVLVILENDDASPSLSVGEALPLMYRNVALTYGKGTNAFLRPTTVCHHEAN